MANQVTARITRLYTTGGKTNIRLDLPSELRPQDNYFELHQTHSNYAALYSLALMAAANRRPLLIRTVNDIRASERAVVQYLVVDWAA